jgi:hypothetical protein
MNKLFFILLLLSSLACSNSNDSESTVVEADSTIATFTYNEKSYEIVKEAKTWEEAVSYAVNRGGYLAEINSAEEQTGIFSALTTSGTIVLDDTNNQYGYAAVWLGGNDITTEGDWVWNGDNDATSVSFWSGAVDGVPVNDLYNNWGNEPDNNGDQDMLCMGLEDTPINEAGEWTDLDGSANTLFFVIEYD